jgi:hypothetical protein
LFPRGSIFTFGFSIEAGQVNCFHSGRDYVAAHSGERACITGLRPRGGQAADHEADRPPISNAKRRAPELAS